MLRRAQGMEYVRMDGARVTAFTPVNSVRTKVYNNITPLQMYAAYNVMLISIVTVLFLVDSVQNFSDECVDDSDCGNKGSCIDIMSTKFPKKQCFCNPGWFGEGCSRGKKN